jgi:hypothetical protein
MFLCEAVVGRRCGRRCGGWEAIGISQKIMVQPRLMRLVCPTTLHKPIM